MKLQISSHLSNFVDNLQARGEYIFTNSQALVFLNCSPAALKQALIRLQHKQRITKLRNTLYLIVPHEYRSMGAPPPIWYVDQLMQFHKQQYYVGLLSAAALLGVAHQQPQIFQIVCEKPLRSITIGRAKISFIMSKSIYQTPTIRRNTPTGTINVSAPEVTALDLIKYIDNAGYYNNVATLLSELSELIDKNKLAETASVGYALPVIQRTGYLLEKYGNAELVTKLHAWLRQQKHRQVKLRTDKPIIENKTDAKWLVNINEIIEEDI